MRSVSMWVGPRAHGKRPASSRAFARSTGSGPRKTGSCGPRSWPREGVGPRELSPALFVARTHTGPGGVLFTLERCCLQNSPLFFHVVVVRRTNELVTH